MNHVLVVGGHSGIGAWTVKQIYKRDDGALLTVPLPTVFDVLHWGMMKACIADYVLRNGPITHVVFSAGINSLDWIGALTKDQTTDIFDVNVIGFIGLLDALKTVHDPEVDDPIRVVAVSSDAATRPLRTSIAYCASKAALNMAVKTAARELGPDGWRINAVAPGMTAETGMTEYVDQRVPEVRGWSKDEAHRYEMQQAVVKRRVQPKEVACTINWLLFDAPDMINGSILEVNGGR